VTRYLLDTNIVSDMVRNPEGRITQRVRRIGEASMATSVIVAAELRFGAEKKKSRRLSD
jgi:tRNA(fMet)-specific endonuclease VapC